LNPYEPIGLEQDHAAGVWAASGRATPNRPTSNRTTSPGLTTGSSNVKAPSFPYQPTRRPPVRVTNAQFPGPPASHCRFS
jgi:hypothetical protein